ncbi:hypothetical protein [Rugamonas sp.]|uniref:hypothetical protein n=1 Tax=Rugamonas sp. TaxID=1926287 RepID=UPI00260054D5|nr:hypothetical protein [Rugamonas sp.]
MVTAAFWRPLSRLTRAVAKKFLFDLPSSCFSAALAALAVQLGLLDIFTKLSLLAVSNLALAPSLPAVAPSQGPVVLYLSEASWQQRYLERSPLDRCRMAEDLQRILDLGPRTLSVDFDLSPGLREDAPACRAQLDGVLDRSAARLVLLAPFRVASDALLQRKADWMLDRCRRGVTFGDGGLNLSLGVVIDYRPASDGLADAVGQRGRSHLCADLRQAGGAERWLRRGAEPYDGADGEPLAIDFAGFAGAASALALEHPALASVDHWGSRDVYFGGDYGGGKEDSFLTSMGPLPGVAIHAAIAWSQAHPVREPSRLLGFGLDLFTAFVFSLGIGFFWKQYLDFSLSKNRWRREGSTLVVLGFVAYFLLMLYLYFQLAVVLFAHGILIVPVLIGLSMLVDGFMRGPIDAFHEREHEHGAAHEHAAKHGGQAARHAGHETARPRRPAWNAWSAALAVGVAGAALGVAGDQCWHGGAGVVSSAFLGLNGALFLLLVLGLLRKVRRLLVLFKRRCRTGFHRRARSARTPALTRPWTASRGRYAVDVLVWTLRWKTSVAALGIALFLILHP